MENLFISNDILDTVPVSFEELQRMAFSPATNEEYADYLLKVFIRARETSKQTALITGVEESLNKILNVS